MSKPAGKKLSKKARLAEEKREEDGKCVCVCVCLVVVVSGRRWCFSRSFCCEMSEKAEAEFKKLFKSFQSRCHELDQTSGDDSVYFPGYCFCHDL